MYKETFESNVASGNDNGGRASLAAEAFTPQSGGKHPKHSPDSVEIPGGQKQGGKASEVPPMPAADGTGSIQSAQSDHVSPPLSSKSGADNHKLSVVALNMYAKDELDLNDDGYVNKAEIHRAKDNLIDKSHGNPNAEQTLKIDALDYLDRNYKTVMEAHDDEFFRENTGITIQDITEVVSNHQKEIRQANSH